MALTALISLTGASSALLPTSPGRQVILVLIDKVTWAELKVAKAPFMKSLIDTGAAGLLSNHTASSYTNTDRSYATISAGNRALAPFASGLALNKRERFDGETGRVLFRRQTGLTPEDSGVFYLDLARLQKANLKTGYKIIPGLLGSELHRAGLKTAVLGNADIDRKLSYERQAAMIAMDVNGAVDFGDVSRDLLKKDSISPFGLRTDYKKLLLRFDNLKERASLVVIETGDSRRADKYQEFATAVVSRKYKAAAIERADAFLSALYKSVDHRKTALIIASPSPPFDEEGSVLQQTTPIISVGPDLKGGPLTSASTRRPAIVTSTDIAPTILKTLGLTQPYFVTGQVMSAEKKSGDYGIDYLVTSVNQYVMTDRWALPLIITYVVFQITVLFIALLVFFSRVFVSSRNIGIVLSLLVAAVALPFAFMATPAIKFSLTSVPAYLAVLAAIVAAVTIISRLIPRRGGPLLLVSLAAAAFTIINLIFFGAWTDLLSVFGYSPIVAGRFYGIGNQSMSVFVASVIAAAAILLEERKENPAYLKWAIALFFTFCVFLIGFPSWGANTDGGTTALVGFAAAYISFFGRGIKLRQIVILTALGVMVIVLFAAADLYLLPIHTHLGRAFQSILSGGLPELQQIAVRKITANVRVFKYTSWSYLLLAIIAVLLFLRFFRPEASERHFFDRYRYLSAGLTGALTGGVVGALTNDSGISIPAIILAYFLVVIFYFHLYDKLRDGNEDLRVIDKKI